MIAVFSRPTIPAGARTRWGLSSVAVDPQGDSFVADTNNSSALTRVGIAR
jgi:hypothetical protein